MNRTVFLTDLRKLLTFMTEEERENTIRYYEGLLDDAGPEKEEALLREFGSPTKAAVTIFREYGKDHSALDPRMPDGKSAEDTVPERFTPENLGLAVPERIEEEADASDEPETDAASDERETDAASDESEAVAASDKPEDDAASDEPEAQTASDESESVPEKTEKSAADIAARIAAGIEAGDAAPKEDTAQPQPKQDEPVFVELPVPPRPQPPMESPYQEQELREYRLPGWAVALILVVTCWLWIPLIAVLGMVVLTCFIVPFVLGAALIAGAAYLAICGIWALGVMTDALLMFGAAAIVLAFGIVLLWLSIWAVIRLFGLLGKGIGGAYRGIFCRRSGKERAE